MSIPFLYKMTIDYNGLKVNVPEPEAFALHKLIVSQRRDKSPKKEKDIYTTKAMFLYFEDKPDHIKRLNEIIDDFSKGWRKKVDQALEKTGTTTGDFWDLLLFILSNRQNASPSAGIKSGIITLM